MIYNTLIHVSHEMYALCSQCCTNQASLYHNIMILDFQGFQNFYVVIFCSSFCIYKTSTSVHIYALNIHIYIAYSFWIELAGVAYPDY